MKTITKRIDPRTINRLVAIFSRKGCIAFAIVLNCVMACPKESRADLYDVYPIARGGVSSINAFGDNAFYFPWNGSVGGGLGWLQTFESVAYANFDLSGIHGQIDQITLSGTASNLFWPLGPQPWANLGIYAQLMVGVSVLSSNPATAPDLSTEFKMITGQSPYQFGSTTGGGSLVDNGLTPPPNTSFFGRPPHTSEFHIAFDPAFFNPISPKGGGRGLISLGFLGNGIAYGLDHRRGVGGTLWIGSLHVRTVPEPASISLALIGILGMMRICRREKRAPASTNR